VYEEALGVRRLAPCVAALWRARDTSGRPTYCACVDPCVPPRTVLIMTARNSADSNHPNELAGSWAPLVPALGATFSMSHAFIKSVNQ